MKNLKIALIAVFAFVGLSAFADTPQWTVYNGVRYQYNADEDISVSKAYSATVYGLSAAATTVEIPASFSVTDENEITLSFKVTKFKAAWTTAVTTGEAKQKSVDGTGITSLTIHVDNMTLPLTNAYAGLTKLESLTIKDATAAPAALKVTNFTDLALTAEACKSLTTIDVEETGITKTGLFFQPSGDAFAKLTTVTLPKGLTEISANAFEGSKVTTLTVPATLATIGVAAFKNSALTAIDLSGTKVTEIPAWAFESSKLASVTFPAELTTIGLGAFYKTAITSIEIPAKVTSLGGQAFEGCEALTTVTGMAKVAAIEDATFKGCKALTSVASGAEITSIGNEAFKGTALTAFEVPAKVTVIKKAAFEDCKSLATVTLAGDKLADLYDDVFKNCEALASVDLSKMTTMASINATMFAGCKSLATITLYEDLTNIAAGAFADCVIENLDLSVTGVTVLNTIFGAHDAKKPNPLKSIILPDGLTQINANVFDYSALTEITLPASLTSAIPAYAFYYCEDLKSVTYLPTHPTTVQVFNTKAFIGCTPFVKINTNSNYFAISTVEPTNATFGLAEDLQVTTVADKGASKKFFGKICAPLHMQISKEDLGDAKLYSVYVDEGVAYFRALKVKSGYYKIKEGENIIVKTNEAATINFELQKAPWETSITEDAIFNFKETVNTADFQAGTVPAAKFTKGTVVPFVNGSNYVYALTNSAKSHGFGFTFYKGTTMPAGAFFIVSTLNPNAAGRLETVWLDEDGNVESEATAINKIQSETEDGAIYNLQGVRVNAAKKGIYIKNGKKYIMK